MDKLNGLVEQFGARHKNVKNRNVAAADIIDKSFLVKQRGHI